MMSRQVQKKAEQAALRLARQFGVEKKKQPKFFELYKSYKSTFSELNESYKDMQWLNGMMQIDGHVSPQALLHYDRYQHAVDSKHKEIDGLETKLVGIMKSIIKMADIQKIIDGAAKALKL